MNKKIKQIPEIHGCAGCIFYDKDNPTWCVQVHIDHSCLDIKNPKIWIYDNTRQED